MAAGVAVCRHTSATGWGRYSPQAPFARRVICGRMKSLTQPLLALLLVLEALFAAGCAHTLQGASKDYHSAEDHVERAVK